MCYATQVRACLLFVREYHIHLPNFKSLYWLFTRVFDSKLFFGLKFINIYVRKLNRFFPVELIYKLQWIFRYNITTDEFDNYGTDHRHNYDPSKVSNCFKYSVPPVSVLKCYNLLDSKSSTVLLNFLNILCKHYQHSTQVFSVYCIIIFPIVHSNLLFC